MNDALTVVTSGVSDGSMSVGVTESQKLANRSRFLQNNGISASATVLVHLRYEGSDYRRYVVVSSDSAGDGIVTPPTIVADALFTKDKDLALLLPVADCIATVLYDCRQNVMGLAHLGRHNLVQLGGTAVVEYMVNNFATDPANLSVFLSAAAGNLAYPLFDFENRGLHEVAIEQLMAVGVPRGAIQVDQRDTTNDGSLFSHSEFLKKKQMVDGRQAVVCMMR